MIVAAAKGRDQSGDLRQRPQIEPDLPDRRPHQRADEHHVAAAVGARQAAETCRPDRDRASGADSARPAPDRQRRATGTAPPCGRGRGGIGDRQRQTAAAANQRERTVLPRGRAGVHESSSPSLRLIAMVSGRLPARMKSTILRTCRIGAEFGFHGVEPRAEFALAEEQRLIGAPDLQDVGLSGAVAAHADDIETDQIGERPMRHAPRNDVGAHAAQAHDHRALADTHELAHRHAAAEHHVVADADVAAEHRAVGDDDAIADTAIVTDMRVDHEEATVADLGEAAVLLGADIGGHALADIAVGADREPGRSAADTSPIAAACRARRRDRSSCAGRCWCGR